MSEMQLTDGSPVPEDRSHTSLRADGQQKGYIVLSPAERAKGFIKPLRYSYVHGGAPPLPEGVRDLTADEKRKWGDDWAKYVEHPPGSRSVGKFFTQEEVARAGKRCGAVTTMGSSIAETYARNPRFYSGTFCCKCGEHFDLKEFAWDPDGEPMDPALQDAWHAARAIQKAEAEKKAATELEQRERAELARLKAKYETNREVL